jgi:hypothetical protein
VNFVHNGLARLTSQRGTAVMRRAPYQSSFRSALLLALKGIFKESASANRLQRTLEINAAVRAESGLVASASAIADQQFAIGLT